MKIKHPSSSSDSQSEPKPWLYSTCWVEGMLLGAVKNKEMAENLLKEKGVSLSLENRLYLRHVIEEGTG